MGKALSVVTAIAGLLLATGCYQYLNEPLPPKDRPAELAGIWVSELDGLTMTFGKDGRYLVQPPDGAAAIKGNYAVEGIGVRLINDKSASVCPGEIGSYTFVTREVSGASFLVRKLQGRFLLVQDHCPMRLAHMQQAYIKQ